MSSDKNKGNGNPEPKEKMGKSSGSNAAKNATETQGNKGHGQQKLQQKKD